MRPAGPACAAVGERRGRTPPSAGHRDRAGGHVHDRDRGAGAARQGRGPRQRRRADARDHRVDRLRPGPADPRARGAHPGSAVASGALRSKDPRRRLLVGSRGRGRARVRLRAVRRADPRRRHVGQRLERRDRPGRCRRTVLRGRAQRRAAAVRAGRPRGDRTGAALGARPRGRADARRRADRDRRADGGQPRRPLRGVARQEPEPAGVPARSHQVAGDLELRAEPARVTATRVASSRRVSAKPRPGRCPRLRASRSPASRRRRCPTSARRRTSPTPSSGSTHPVAPRCRWRRCAATSCSSTSGPTRASTASARCRSSRACTRPTTRTGSRSSAWRPPSSRSSRTPPTSSRRSIQTASPTRSCRTTSTAPGARTRTSTGRRST